MGKRFVQGDIFAVPLPDGTYLFGRVMLDIYAALKKRLFPADSSLAGMGKALLIEMYQEVAKTLDYQPSPLLIPGAILEPDEVGVTWPVVSNVPVDVHDVQFPEAMVGNRHPSGDVPFLCGKIRLPLPFTERDLDSMRVLQTVHSEFLWPYVCLHELGREGEIPDDCRPTSNLFGADLRVTQFRSEVYQHLPIRPSDSYYVPQKQLGLELERFYEQSADGH